MRKGRFVVILALVLTMVLGNFAYAEETESFTWWIARNEDTSYYDAYNDNPVLRYTLSEFDYNGKKLDIDFWAGVSGSEKENFNNMLATGDLSDVMDLSFSDYTPTTLYEDGYIIDLTELAQEYMPNYMELVNENETVAEYAWSIVDGEKKMLHVIDYAKNQDPFEGYCYRRDWIAKYGTNPVTSEAFTYGTDENGVWYDDVVFPCGETTPYYISDWEWMFEIFTKAMADLGIEDGYCISIYYHGYMATGDLYSGFGGGCPWWYRDADNVIRFGGNTDTMRAYLKCMNTWYKNGWLDPAFAERSSDMFYIIDSSSVHQGKIGMWQGRSSEVGSEMNIGTANTEGIMIFGCPQPINDIYGDEAQKNVVPDCYYKLPNINIGVGIPPSAAKKDLPVLLSYIDSLFTEEGGRMAGNGLSREDLAAMDESDPWYQMYMKFGVTDGQYYSLEVDGKTVYYYHELDALLGNAMKLNRIPKGNMSTLLHSAEERSPILQNAVDMWVLYPTPAYIGDNIESMLSASDSAKRAKIENNILTYMAQSVPKFIMGYNGFDIYNDTDWANYAKVIDKYGVDKASSMYQEALDALKE